MSASAAGEVTCSSCPATAEIETAALNGQPELVKQRKKSLDRLLKNTCRRHPENAPVLRDTHKKRIPRCA
jgi:hypothetical protein